MSIVLPVSNTVGVAGAGVAAGAVSTFNRTFSMTGALGTVVLNGDSVKIQGSTDGGSTYQDLVVGAGTASSSMLTLQFSRPEAVINDACTHYRTVRLTFAPGSTLAAVGMSAAAVQSTGNTFAIFQKDTADAAANTLTVNEPFFRAPSTLNVGDMWLTPNAALTSSDTVYATITISLYRAASLIGVVGTITTKTTGGGGTGDWVALTQIPFVAGPQLVMQAGDNLVVAIAKASTGTAVPICSMQINF